MKDKTVEAIVETLHTTNAFLRSAAVLCEAAAEYYGAKTRERFFDKKVYPEKLNPRKTTKL